MERSTTLDQYIGSELEAEWRARLTVSQPLGLASIVLTFAAPALIPRGLIESLPLDKAVAFIEGACAFDDPFGLVGALQTCADRVVGDARFVVLGERLLDRLFGNMDRLTTACQLFAAAFIIATAHLSEHETLDRQPVYWRRLAAASHASLVVRTCGISDAKQDGLIRWAVLVSGDTYLLSVLSDFSEQPRWRPEWITDDFLVADIYGRALSALSGIPSEHVPASWQTRLDQVKAWAYKTPMEIKAHFPAALEGARRSELPDLSKLEPVGGVLRPLIDEPSPEHLLMISFVIYTFGFPPELRDKIIAVVCQIRHSPLTLDDRQMQQVISIASHIAAETRDPELADAITDTCIAKVVAATELQAATEAMFRLIECAAACQSRSAAAPQLAERLERLAFVLPTAAMCKRLASLLGCLKTVHPELASLLGRALAAANLGGNRSGG